MHAHTIGQCLRLIVHPQYPLPLPAYGCSSLVGIDIHHKCVCGPVHNGCVCCVQVAEAQSLLANTSSLVEQQLQLPAHSCAVITNGRVLWVHDPKEPDSLTPGGCCQRQPLPGVKQLHCLGNDPPGCVHPPCACLLMLA